MQSASLSGLFLVDLLFFPQTVDRTEIQALISRLADPCRTVVIFALSTGMRCSELFALKWLDFNWAQLTVLARRAIDDGVVGEVKTKYLYRGRPVNPNSYFVDRTHIRFPQMDVAPNCCFGHSAGSNAVRQLIGATPASRPHSSKRQETSVSS